MALEQEEAGTPVADVCRKLRQLRDENKKLKQLVAHLTLGKHVLQQSRKYRFEHPGETSVLQTAGSFGFHQRPTNFFRKIGCLSSMVEGRSQNKN